ncbi:MAG: VWA domain-containing protein [Oscillochloris sp.]|nr:VWA domain-containing protein [Oscillochloris sp.]
MGAPRLIRRRAAGQSLPLIGLMIVVLVAMVGLSVDVGNTFAEERQAVAASHAASIAGMNAYLDRTGATTNQRVYTAIADALRANGVDINNPGESRRVEALYLNAQGTPIESASPTISNDASPVPQDVAYVQVKVDGEVDTFFARVVNRNDLPINANSFAGRCPSGSGVYPISVDNSYIRGNEFVEPTNGDPEEFERIEGGLYDGYTKRRIYVGSNGTPGSFGWLRWMENTGANGASAKSAQELEASLNGFGNLAAGFEEVVPWPSTSQPAPATYPEKPGELNPGDWVYGTAGWNNSSDQRAIMEAHMTNGTQMILPIYSTVLDNGANAKFHIVRLGLFLIIDRNLTGSDKWFDMIFLGDATRQETACAATPPPPGTMTFELFGDVGYYPEYPFYPTDHRPVQYVVVLDTSGSMNMNFAGEGMQNNKVVQCTNGPPGAPPSQNCGNANSAWPEQEKRRIYIAKKSIELLIRETNMPGNPGYKADLPKDTMALVWYNDTVPTSWSKGFRSDPNAIITDVTNANKQNGDPYKSGGGTNGAAALYRAADILQNAPKETTELGKDWPYKRVVIFITDGVSNQFLDTSKGNLGGGPSNNGTYPTGHTCNKQNAVAENAPCQTTAVGGIYDKKKWDRPITQMVNVSTDLIKNNAALQVGDTKPTVYVLALSNIPEAGLKDGVATSSINFFPAEDLEVNKATGRNNVEDIMILINKQVESGACIAQTEDYTRVMPSSSFEAIDGLSYPNVGKVVIRDTNTNVSYEAPVKADNAGRLSYRFTDIPRGTYEMFVYIYLKHPLDDEDAPPRVYSDILVNEERQSSMTVVVDRSGQDVGGLNVIKQDVDLKLSGAVCSVN